ncbi:MAG: CPBP family intramembrane metalloprotease [Deltaproteobacteria bacterium]|nr:CPBP family intramembrane metalloprotease [Deltaproteobacteria bacterium]PIU78255.1 MAG: hypothetical protein COS73_07675 [Nitrospirae bacterium CG06_land_8_20_14_3_00_70_43]PIW82783.1 MAG: hypothetical protein COZ96_06905 [Nitrospirae bacterium CG_4_8_14_3_um_filter_70_85]PIX84267.1 MAG: hypothetical protein COZ33_01095 [Nitrospirae bacterium CG_4_10_14_3_um_filter_70_108]PJB95314.1 MAG: hypothetical protein CO080_08265 [Nitrospirae bacterium CG_4_9_14_0_8_um_filter_70_14]
MTFPAAPHRGDEGVATPPPPAGARVEGLLVWAAITAALALRSWPEWVVPLLPSLWINLPLISLVARHEPLAAWGVCRPEMGATAGHLALFLALIMPLSLAALARVGAIEVTWDLAPTRLATTLARQLLWVALPEELFFRGYLWRRLADPRRGRAAAIVANGLLFAATHALIHPSGWAVATVLPGCYFAWLRCRTHNVAAPILTHALANTLLFAACGGW